MRGDGRAGGLAESGDDVDHTRREAGLLDKLGEDEGRERCLLSGLQDDGVTRGQSRANLPGEHQQREVPGDDLAADTDGLRTGVMEHVGVDVDGLALDLVSPAAVVADAANDGSDITAGHSDRLAVVEGLDGSQQLGILLGNVGELEQHQTALLGSDPAPDALKGLAGRGNGDINILLGGLAYRDNDLLRGRVDDLELLLLNTLNELVVDEPDRC